MFSDQEFNVEADPAENYSKLFDYVYVLFDVKMEHGFKNVLIQFVLKTFLFSPETDLGMVEFINAQINNYEKSFPGMETFIPVLDFKEMEETWGEDRVIKFMLKHLKSVNSDALIVINLHKDKVKRIAKDFLHISKTDIKERHIWKPGQFLL